MTLVHIFFLVLLFAGRLSRADFLENFMPEKYHRPNTISK